MDNLRSTDTVARVRLGNETTVVERAASKNLASLDLANEVLPGFCPRIPANSHSTTQSDALMPDAMFRQHMLPT
jgi:hypothetical protein